jgi:hypothetical protein
MEYKCFKLSLAFTAANSCSILDSDEASYIMLYEDTCTLYCPGPFLSR